MNDPADTPPPLPPSPTTDLADLRAAFAAMPFAQLLGLEFNDAARGEARVSLAPRLELTRLGDILHGGALASLVDTAAAFAVMSLLAPGEQTVTVDLTIHYLSAVTPATSRLDAHARVLRAGQRLATVAVNVTDERDRLIATALTTYAKRA